MDFSRIEPRPQDKQLMGDVAAFANAIAPDAFSAEEHNAATAFNESVHQELGARGWIMPAWPREEGGAGLDLVGVRILELELNRHRYPDTPLRLIRNVWIAVERHLDSALLADIKPKVAAGEIRFCLGYTEPEGGSDLAAVKTRAVADGDEWVINGSKMFTTGAEYAQYVLLLTRTDPNQPKHRGLTVFLVPMDTPGVIVHELRTFGGERTNVTIYDDVRIPDQYRLGEPNHGWAVVREPLDDEHSMSEATGLNEISTGRDFLRYLERALDAAARYIATSVHPDGSRPADDASIQARLGMVATELEAAISAPGPFGRVTGSETLIRNAAELIDLVGPAALLTATDYAEDCSYVEFAHRFAQGTSKYQGTVEVFRNIIARHNLGLPQLSLPG